jgi:hypothetical protein
LASIDKKIVISSPTDFSTSMNLKLHIPRNVCPTVEAKKGGVFRVEYLVQVQVNLNDQSPKSPGRRTDIITFDVPFTIGTYPSLVQCIEDDDEGVDEGVEELDIISDSAISDQLSDTMSSLSAGSNSAPQDGGDPKNQQYELPISIQDDLNTTNYHHNTKPDEPSATKNNHKEDDSQLPIEIPVLDDHQPTVNVTTPPTLQPKLSIHISPDPSPQIPEQMSPSLGSVYIGPSRDSSVAGSIHRRSTQMSSTSTQVYLPMNSTQPEPTPTQLPVMLQSPVPPERHNTTMSHIHRRSNPPMRINTVTSGASIIQPTLSPILPGNMSPNSRPISQGGAFHWVPPSTDNLQSPHTQPPRLIPSLSDSTQRYSQSHYQRDDHLYNMNNHSYTNITPIPNAMPTSMPHDNYNNNFPMSPISPIPPYNNYPQRYPSNASNYPQRHPSNASNYPQRHPSNASNYPVSSHPPAHFYMPEPSTGY